MNSDGPAMVISPSQDPFQFTPNTLEPTYPAVPPTGTGLTNGTTKPSPSRKRSRDDAGFEEALNSSAPALSTSIPTPETVTAATATATAPPPTSIIPEEPVYGEGMVLLNPRTGLGVSAESQTGTWYEETKAAAANAAAKPRGGADQSSRKAKRLDPSASGLDDIALSQLQAAEADGHRALDGSAGGAPEPPVDDATRLLGISWQRVADDDDKAPAVRGWTKYIDNQYAAYLADSKILMKSRSLNAFLVAARVVTAADAPTWYFLFSDDLDQARIVGSSWDMCVRNLRSNPVVFETGDVLVASDKASGPAQGVGGMGMGPGMEIDH